MSGWAALRVAGLAELHRQAEAWANPAAAQQQRLQRVLVQTAGTAFGREHGLQSRMSIADWRKAVPVRRAEEFQPWIERIIRGEPQVLTSDPVLAFELTGGSSGGKRAVPYCATLLDDFRAGLLAWLGDLLQSAPAIAEGRAYFAVSPVLPFGQTTLGPHPVGLGSDLAYFGEAMAAKLGPLLVWHPAMTTAGEADWATATAAHLVAARDLSLISVWSPTFLARLMDEIEGGTLPGLLHDGAFGLPPDPARARELETAGLDVQRLWPKVALVSAWADAASARPAEALKARLGNAGFQPKGLLATEGLFTLPLLGVPSPLPVLTACFLEFQDDAGGVHLIDDLEDGQSYDLIVTTGGGLQRFLIGDRVTVTGRVIMPADWRLPQPSPRLPMLRFAGRSAASDLAGEKLTEAFVLTCLDGLPGQPLLAAEEGPPARYELWFDASNKPADPAEYLTCLDRRLSHNPQYDYARRLGQLAKLQFRVCDDLRGKYVSYRLGLGHRLSDIKPPVLLAPGPLSPRNWAGQDVAFPE